MTLCYLFVFLLQNRQFMLNVEYKTLGQVRQNNSAVTLLTLVL